MGDDKDTAANAIEINLVRMLHPPLGKVPRVGLLFPVNVPGLGES
jgi:hypothetical protein